jgi:DNA-binding transcriptional ArsR family regulator
VYEVTVAQAAQVFKMLGDERRLRLLLLLAQRGHLSVSALSAALGHQQAAVSHSLKLLRLAGLVWFQREGASNFYALAPGHGRDLLRGIKP